MGAKVSNFYIFDGDENVIEDVLTLFALRYLVIR